eukprot:4296262-Amphidinium_carterae.1
MGKRWDNAIIRVQAKVAVLPCTGLLVSSVANKETQIATDVCNGQVVISSATVELGTGGMRRSSAMARQLDHHPIIIFSSSHHHIII